jgi:hypothetical protein
MAANSGATNVLECSSVGYMARSGIAQSQDMYIFGFDSYFQIAFQGDHTNSHFLARL